jgi:hypothetical protein
MQNWVKEMFEIQRTEGPVPVTNVVELVNNALLPPETRKAWLRKLERDSDLQVAYTWSDVAYYSEVPRVIPRKGSASLGVNWGRERADSDNEETDSDNEAGPAEREAEREAAE